MWELDPRKCNSREPFLTENWETAGVGNFNLLIIF